MILTNPGINTRGIFTSLAHTGNYARRCCYSPPPPLLRKQVKYLKSHTSTIKKQGIKIPKGSIIFSINVPSVASL